MTKRLAAVLAGFLVVLSAFLGYRQLNPKIVATHAHAPLLSFDDLQGHADLIVHVTPLTNVSQHLELTRQDELPLYWYTVTEVRVDRVFKGSEVKTGETLTVSEPYALWRNPIGAHLIATGEYRPLATGRTYVLFLSKSASTQAFTITGEHQGKFVLAPRSMAPADLEVGDVDPSYQALHHQVIAKYGKAD